MTGHFARALSVGLAALLFASNASSASSASSALPAAASHSCAADATARAAKLLALQAEGDERAAVNARSVMALKPVRNPANGKQKFDVLAISGNVYKAEYRMRFLYAQIPGQCVLVGQEILEFTGL